MEERSTDSTLIKVLRFYREWMRANPFLALAILMFSMIVYLGFLEVILTGRTPLSLVRRLFEAEPRLKITINPMEKYQAGATMLTLKRIEVSNQAQPLRSVKISIRTPDWVENVKINMTPEVQCQSTKFGPSEGRVLFEIWCDSFDRNQKGEISLATTKRVDEKATVVIEVIGSYAQDRFVGASASGMLGK